MVVRTFPWSVTAVLILAGCAVMAGVVAPDVPESLRKPIQWVSTPPLQSPIAHPGMDCYSVKDPTIVRHGGKWHLFTTIRGTPRSIGSGLVSTTA